ncbi:hypothetical protein VS878_22250, partial [Salmonella enterica subsp. enterica serovar Paratyphi A]|nr:hypothetical protein [Salmonella enterica subsp. enterica serovar Paratyphi A]
SATEWARKRILIVALIYFRTAADSNVFCSETPWQLALLRFLLGDRMGPEKNPYRRADLFPYCC